MELVKARHGARVILYNDVILYKDSDIFRLICNEARGVMVDYAKIGFL